jgi:short-subunit dehydrogenase
MITLLPVGHCHIIIVGRNKTKAEDVIASLQKSAESEYEFVQCGDISLIKDVISASAAIRERVDTINYLFMSQGVWNLGGFSPTAEGIDVRCAIKFYTRWKVRIPYSNLLFNQALNLSLVR